MIAATPFPVADRARLRVGRTPLLLLALLVLLIVGMIPAGMVGMAEAQCDRTDEHGNPD